VQAKVFGYADSTTGPVERVCWARFYAELALQANTSMLVYGDSPFWVEIFVFAFGGFEEFLALSFGGAFRFMLGSVDKHVENVYSWSVFLGHFCVSYWQVVFVVTGIKFGELLLLIPAEEVNSPCKRLITAFGSSLGW
jgi:hypothetical protein